MRVSEFIEEYEIGKRNNGFLKDVRAVVSVESYGGFDNMQLRVSGGHLIFNWTDAYADGFPDHNNNYSFFEEKKSSTVSSRGTVEVNDTGDSYEFTSDDGLIISVHFE